MMSDSISLRKLIGTSSLLAWLVIALGLPVAYGICNYTKAQTALAMIARINSDELATTGLPLEELASTQAKRLEHAQDLSGFKKQHISWELINLQGISIKKHGENPEWPSVQHTTVIKAHDANLGALKLQTSTQHLIGSLSWFTALCTILGTAVAIGLGALKTRALDRLLSDHRAENLRFNTAINNMSQGLCFFDKQQRLIVCNRRYAEMYKLSLDLVRPGTTLSEIVGYRYAAGCCPDMTQADYLAKLQLTAISNQVGDSVITLKDGRIFAVHHEPMPDGSWVSTHEDITEHKRAVAQIEHLALHDSLTGLANRVLFWERLNEAVSRNHVGESVAVLCMDLDHFKIVNDTLGHPVGDELLRQVSARLSECLRQSDTVARLGGDEFAIIQTGQQQPEASRALAERLVRVITAPFTIANQQILVGASIGIALSLTEGLNPQDLLKKADLALYDAKARGRRTYSYFKLHMDERAQTRRSLGIDLQHALLNNEFELHYQPIVELKNRRTVGFEALLRWRHPTFGMLRPDRFIGLAEETGQIEAIGEWVIHEAFAQAVLWPQNLSVAINLSPAQLRSSQLVSVISAALERSGLAANRVEFEITEPVLMPGSSNNLAVLHELRALGVRMSLDDFGVGSASLSHLRAFPFKKIKIDGSFTRDLVGNSSAAAIVKAMVTLCASMNMLITAEGVETEEQFERLRELGCDEAQGNLISPPTPPQQIDHSVRSDRRLMLVAGTG
jgi:diguanylate cyclase (GGDEF)-like protein